MSFCFYVSEDNQRWSERDGVNVRERLKVDKVIEVSAVNVPAYGGTNIDSRSLDSDRRALDRARIALDNAKKTKPDYKAKTLITMYKDVYKRQIKNRFGNWERAYIIDGGAAKTPRNNRIKDLGAEPIFIDTDKETCLKLSLIHI